MPWLKDRARQGIRTDSSFPKYLDGNILNRAVLVGKGNVCCELVQCSCRVQPIFGHVKTCGVLTLRKPRAPKPWANKTFLLFTCLALGPFPLWLTGVCSRQSLGMGGVSLSNSLSTTCISVKLIQAITNRGC